VSKAAKRARKKEGRQSRLEAEKKAAAKRRTRNRNIFLGVVLVVLLGFFAFNQLTAKKKTKVSTTTPPGVTTTATPTATASVPVAVSGTSTATATPAAGACSTTKPARGATVSQSTPPPMTVSTSKTYTATIVTSCGTMVASLDVKDSPNTVNDFVYLASKGFYDGLTFQRIVKDFAIQGGDPKGDGTGGSGYEVKDPIPSGFQYTKGVLAMANAGTTGGAGSQFFIVPADKAAAGFQPLYAVLGKVTSGLDVVDKLNAVATGPNPGNPNEQSSPLAQVYIGKITIATS
jgi:cyclophilin family peptidyl-prolyl cis-trans isomerase